MSNPGHTLEDLCIAALCSHDQRQFEAWDKDAQVYRCPRCGVRLKVWPGSPRYDHDRTMDAQS